MATGERIEITARGRPIAMLVPIHADPWQALVESGRVVAPTATGDLLDEPPVNHGIDASAHLAALRDAER